MLIACPQRWTGDLPVTSLHLSASSRSSHSFHTTAAADLQVRVHELPNERWKVIIHSLYCQLTAPVITSCSLAFLFPQSGCSHAVNICMNIAPDNLCGDVYSSIIDWKLLSMCPYSMFLWCAEALLAISLREEKRGGWSGGGDLQGLRCVECAGGEMSWQPSQAIHVCLKNAVVMGNDASALLSWVLAVGVYHHSRNGLLLCFSLYLHKLCFLDLGRNFCVPFGWTGFHIWLFRRKCQWTVVKECKCVISVPTYRCFMVESRVWCEPRESEAEHFTILPCWWWLVKIYPRETKAFFINYTPERRENHTSVERDCRPVDPSNYFEKESRESVSLSVQIMITVQTQSQSTVLHHITCIV